MKDRLLSSQVATEVVIIAGEILVAEEGLVTAGSGAFQTVEGTGAGGKIG